MNKLVKYGTDLYSFLKGLTTKNKDCVNGNILIIEGGHIGDILMDATALYTVITHYRQAGKNVFFLCTPSLWSMLSRCYDLHGIAYVGEELTYDLQYEAVRKVLKQFKNITFESIIAIHNGDPRIWWLVARIAAKQKWSVIQEENKGIKSKIKCSFVNHSHTHVIWGNKKQYQLRYLCNLLKELHIENYQANNVYLPPKNGIPVPSTPYVTIALDTANKSRRWPAQNFIDLIRQILKEYEVTVYLVGTAIPADMQKQLDRAFQADSEKVINLIGKTNMSEWIEFIRGSRFLVGVDSGAIHVAAAVGTPAFCLSGVWDGYKCLPYDVDIVTRGTVLPICIYRQDTDVNRLPCYDCRYHGRYGSGNAECLARCKAGQPCLCLSKITPEDVMNTIRQTVDIRRD